MVTCTSKRYERVRADRALGLSASTWHWCNPPSMYCRYCLIAVAVFVPCIAFPPPPPNLVREHTSRRWVQRLRRTGSPKIPAKGQRAKVDIFTIDIPRFLQDKEIVLFMPLLTLRCVFSGSFHETAKVVHSLRISTTGITMKAELGRSGIVPSMMSDANQEEAIEAASASMGDHERADSVLGAKSAWPGGVCDGVVGSWRWGISASDALAGNEGPWEVSWT